MDRVRQLTLLPGDPDRYVSAEITYSRPFGVQYVPKCVLMAREMLDSSVVPSFVKTSQFKTSFKAWIAKVPAVLANGPHPHLQTWDGLRLVLLKRFGHWSWNQAKRFVVEGKVPLEKGYFGRPNDKHLGIDVTEKKGSVGVESWTFDKDPSAPDGGDDDEGGDNDAGDAGDGDVATTTHRRMVGRNSRSVLSGVRPMRA